VLFHRNSDSDPEKKHRILSSEIELNLKEKLKMKSSLLKRILQGVLSLGTAVALFGCNGDVVYIPGGGGTGGGPITYAWYDLFGNGCATSTQGPRPGCNFYWYSSKLVKIIDQEDPYFTPYYYNLTYDNYRYTLNGTTYSYTGFAWISPTGIIYDEYGNALNQKKGKGRDVVKDVAKAELNVVVSAGKSFAARYALSEAKGIEIAKTLNDWAKIGKDRIRSEQDLSVFTQRLFGVEYGKVKDALMEAQKGNQELMNKTISEAAHSWGTNEEGMKLVLKNWFSGFDVIK
jgi:predicted Fe-Mo cluster-binding NifX family protein